MDKDRVAVKLSLQAMAKDAILGIFGPAEVDECLHKMHTIIEFAQNLRINSFEVKVNLDELKHAKAEYEKEIKDSESIDD